MAAFFYLLKHIERKNSFKLGLSFGFGWFAAGIHWVHVSIDQYGGLPLLASLGMMLLLVLYLALYPALFAYLIKRFCPEKTWLFALPAMWGFTEFLRGWLLSGFPWLSIGYGQIDGPLAVWATLIGESGLSLVLVTLGWSIAKTTDKGLIKSLAASKMSEQKRYVIFAFALFALPLMLGSFNPQIDKQRSINVTLVQGNIPQSLRWVPEQDWPTMEKYLNLTEPYWQNSDLIIWPEAAVPKIEPLAQEYLQYLDTLAFDNNTALITGIADVSFITREAWNNLIVLGKKSTQDETTSYSYGHINRYSKHHLLPIGEFIPFENWLRGLAPIFDLPMSSFSRGDYIQPDLIANDLNIAANICFEILFAQQVLDNIKANTDFILTVSNDAWFGSSIGPHQHMEIARMRALELGLPVIRATNNGITGIIDVNGKITTVAPQFKDAVLTATMELKRVNTLYAASYGTSFWLLWILLSLLTGISIRKSKP